MADAYRRHDISDAGWERLEPHLPGRKGTWGGNARDNRQFINAVFWILRTGAPWRDLPPSYGDWKNTHRRFCRWRDKGVWERLLEVLIDEPELKMLMNAMCKFFVRDFEEKQEKRMFGLLIAQTSSTLGYSTTHLRRGVQTCSRKTISPKYTA